MWYFQCSIKVSPCITKCLENFVFQVSELVSKFKQHFSDEPPEVGTVRRVVIYCDGGCHCSDIYLSVGVEKLKEIEKSMEKNSITFIKTKTELLFGNDRDQPLDLRRESESEIRDSNMQTNVPVYKPEISLQEDKNPQTNIPIEFGNENAKIKVKLDVLVQGKLDETPTEEGLVDETQAQNTESATNEELSPPTQDMIDRNNEKNKALDQEDQLKENELDGNEDEKGPRYLKSDEIEKSDEIKVMKNLKSDEIEIDIEGLENEEHTLNREDSRTESEKNLERGSEVDLRTRTTSELEYLRFINEFANFYE